MRGAISGNQRPSKFISGHQRPSEAISGHQRSYSRAFGCVVSRSSEPQGGGKLAYDA